MVLNFTGTLFRYFVARQYFTGFYFHDLIQKYEKRAFYFIYLLVFNFAIFLQSQIQKTGFKNPTILMITLNSQDVNCLFPFGFCNAPLTSKDLRCILSRFSLSLITVNYLPCWHLISRYFISIFWPNSISQGLVLRITVIRKIWKKGVTFGENFYLRLFNFAIVFTVVNNVKLCTTKVINAQNIILFNFMGPRGGI